MKQFIYYYKKKSEELEISNNSRININEEYENNNYIRDSITE